MSNKTQQSNAFFTGSYVDEMRELFVVSLVSGIHSVAMGAPGWGKTDIVAALLEEVMPDEHKMVRIQPATGRGEVEGTADMDELLQNSRFTINQADTAFDSKWKALIVDEIGRANRMIVGTLMFLMDRKDLQFAPPILATSNYMPTAPEAAAMLDRIGLWYWVKVQNSDFAEVAKAQLMGLGGGLRVPGKLPTMAEIEAARHSIPDDKTISVVADVVDRVGQEAAQAGMIVNPRRLTQWTKVVYHYSAYLLGTPNFTTVPAEAVRALRFANIAREQKDYDAWALLIQGMADPIGAAIESIMASAADAFNIFVDAGSTDFAQAGRVIAEKQAELKALGNDPRIKECTTELTKWFALASQGKKISR